MQTLLFTLILINGLCFLIHGTSCLTTASMRKEFQRYGLSRQRKLVGVLQLIGAAGLLAGLVFRPLAIAGALGLALLMALGVSVRIRCGDHPVQMLPAALYALCNAGLVVLLLR
jgi:uncharacterized membrane protein YphA (DoxX/SURF4 family)